MGPDIKITGPDAAPAASVDVDPDSIDSIDALRAALRSAQRAARLRSVEVDVHREATRHALGQLLAVMLPFMKGDADGVYDALQAAVSKYVVVVPDGTARAIH